MTIVKRMLFTAAALVSLSGFALEADADGRKLLANGDAAARGNGIGVSPGRSTEDCDTCGNDAGGYRNQDSGFGSGAGGDTDRDSSGYGSEVPGSKGRDSSGYQHGSGAGGRDKRDCNCENGGSGAGTGGSTGSEDRDLKRDEMNQSPKNKEYK